MLEQSHHHRIPFFLVEQYTLSPWQWEEMLLLSPRPRSICAPGSGAGSTLTYCLWVGAGDSERVYTTHFLWRVGATSPIGTPTLCSECWPSLFSRDSQSLGTNSSSGVGALASKTLRQKMLSVIMVINYQILLA